MAYFGKYIRQILSRQETVVFPGFGSLVLKEGSGIKGEDGKIDPPGMVIKFDSTHPLGDGKLASEYAQGEGIATEEARQQLLELVDAIKFKLDKGEEYDLPLVGRFSRDNDNRIHFQKDQNWVIDPELFGLNSLDLLELETAPEKESESPLISPSETKREPAQHKKEPAKKIIQQKEAIDKKHEVKSARKPVNKWKIIWIVIGSLIAVLVLILLIPAGEGGDGIEFSKDGIVLKDSQSESRPESVKRDKRVNADKPETESSANEESEESEVNAHTPNVASSSVNSYYIIAGSFQNLQNAADLSERLKSNGFPSEIIYTENRLYRVSVKSYATKNEAQSDLNNVKSASGMESAWIWKK